MVKVKLARWQGPLVPEVEHVERARVVPEVPPLDTAQLFGKPRTWSGGAFQFHNLRCFTATSGVLDAVKPEYRGRRYAKFDGAEPELKLAQRLAERGYVEEFLGHGCYVQKPAVCDAFQTDDRAVEHCGVCQQHRSAHKEPL